MTTALWREVREAYYDAVRAWVKDDPGTAALMLRIAIKRSEMLIAYLEKEHPKGDGDA